MYNILFRRQNFHLRIYSRKKNFFKYALICLFSWLTSGTKLVYITLLASLSYQFTYICLMNYTLSAETYVIFSYFLFEFLHSKNIFWQNYSDVNLKVWKFYLYVLAKILLSSPPTKKKIFFFRFQNMRNILIHNISLFWCVLMF